LSDSALPPVVILLITYKRTETALRTIRGLRDHLDYPNLHWHIADDGSDSGHLETLIEAIGRSDVTTTNAARKGVGVSMNLGQDAAFRRGDYVLWLEDDWELSSRFDLRPCVQLCEERQEIGMVRLGYVSPGIKGELIAGAGRLWWKLERGPTYTFVGHAALRHKRFRETYGPYVEGHTPGETELWMCGTFNNRQGPEIVVPAFAGEWGFFGHIGGESLKNMMPG
jgi:glycosyltransferase involved in cell wall biosynthesis